MAYQQAFNAYKQTGVKTASRGKLIIMLYDAAIRQLSTAVSWFDNQGGISPEKIEKLNANILKTQEIITELMVSLDMNAGGDIAKNLLSLYMFFNQELLNANINHDSKKIEDVRTMMNDLRSAWAEADIKTATHVPEIHQSVNIEG